VDVTMPPSEMNNDEMNNDPYDRLHPDSHRELQYELLLSRKVTDSEGKTMGRLEEASAAMVGGECVVQEFHVGGFSGLERLGNVTLISRLIRTLGGDRFYRTFVVPADQLDLSDPRHPRARRPMDEFQTLRSEAES
jgi:hypothetical protein